MVEEELIADRKDQLHLSRDPVIQELMSDNNSVAEA